MQVGYRMLWLLLTSSAKEVGGGYSPNYLEGVPSGPSV